MSKSDGKSGKRVGDGKPNRKAKMVLAAETLLRERGVGGVTTRAIAEAVPCSEGAIYVHFHDRLELLLAVLHQALPEMVEPLHALEGKVGKRTPKENLVAALDGLQRFHERVAPMMCSLIAEPELLRRFRESLQTEGKGPHRGVATIARYIEQEQKLGRIHAGIRANTAASVLMASSFFHVFTALLFGSAGKLHAARLVDLAIHRSDGDEE